MRVVGLGHCTLDHIGVVRRFPEADQKLQLHELSLQGGGSVATALVALARWGVAASFVGKVGGDWRGEHVRKTLQEDGVEVDHLVVDAEAISQFSFIVLESRSGHRHTYVTYGNVGTLSLAEVDPSTILDGAGLLHLDTLHLHAALTLARAAQQRQIPVVLKAGEVLGQEEADVAELVGVCDVLLASERFASRFAGRGELEAMCRALLERGPHTVVITMGDEGSVGMTRHQTHGEAGRLLREASYPVEVRDPTGSGDVFGGALIYGVLQDSSLSRSMRLANIAAGLSCQGVGGRSAIPEREEVLRLLESGG